MKNEELKNQQFSIFRIMKQRMILLTGMMLVSVSMFAAGGTSAGIVIDLGTFAGITAVVSALVTQLLKLVPAIAGNKLAKIGISAGVGIAVCMAAWLLHVSAPLDGLSWWQALLYGLASGLSGCGFYDLVKAVAALFKKDDE